MKAISTQAKIGARETCRSGVEMYFLGLIALWQPGQRATRPVMTILGGFVFHQSCACGFGSGGFFLRGEAVGITVWTSVTQKSTILIQNVFQIRLMTYDSESDLQVELVETKSRNETGDTVDSQNLCPC